MIKRHCGQNITEGVWYGMAWQGVVWRGVAWCGVAWRGAAWRGVAWYGRRLLTLKSSQIHKWKRAGETRSSSGLLNWSCCAKSQAQHAWEERQISDSFLQIGSWSSTWVVLDLKKWQPFLWKHLDALKSRKSVVDIQKIQFWMKTDVAINFFLHTVIPLPARLAIWLLHIVVLVATQYSWRLQE